MVNARELMVQAMLSRVIARGTKAKIWTLSTLPPDPMDIALVTRTTADAWMNYACTVDGMFMDGMFMHSITQILMILILHTS